MYEEIKAAAWQGAPLGAVVAGLGLTLAEMLRRYPRAQSVHDAARKAAERALTIPGWSRTPEGLWERIRLPRPQIEPAPEHIPDAFEQPWWTLKQVLTWLSSGNRDLVRDVGPVDGFESTFTIRDLRVLGRNGACYRTFEEAEDALMQALRAGRLTATGKENGEGDRKDIPSLQWPDLRLQYEPHYFAASKDFSRTATYYNDLLFPCKGVLANWPDPRESLGMADKQKTSTTAKGKRTDLEEAVSRCHPNAEGGPQAGAETTDLMPVKPQNETSGERRARITARYQELKAGGNRHPTKTVAEEEGISRRRVLELMENKPKADEASSTRPFPKARQ